MVTVWFQSWTTRFPRSRGAQRKARQPRQATAERRAEILRAAANTFGSKGYMNGSLAEVAEQVGITHAGVLHHFGSKEQLLVEVLEYRDKEDVRDLEGQHIPGRYRAVPAPRAHRADERRPPRHRAGLHRADRRVRHREPPRARLGDRALHGPARRDPRPPSLDVGGGRRVPRSSPTAPRARSSPSWTACRCSGSSTTDVDLPVATQFAIEAILDGALAGARGRTAPASADPFSDCSQGRSRLAAR